jgi:hypothetical protein
MNLLIASACAQVLRVDVVADLHWFRSELLLDPWRVLAPLAGPRWSLLGVEQTVRSAPACRPPPRRRPAGVSSTAMPETCHVADEDLVGAEAECVPVGASGRVVLVIHFPSVVALCPRDHRRHHCHGVQPHYGEERGNTQRRASRLRRQQAPLRPRRTHPGPLTGRRMRRSSPSSPPSGARVSGSTWSIRTCRGTKRSGLRGRGRNGSGPAHGPFRSCCHL